MLYDYVDSGNSATLVHRFALVASRVVYEARDRNHRRTSCAVRSNPSLTIRRGRDKTPRAERRGNPGRTTATGNGPRLIDEGRNQTRRNA